MVESREEAVDATNDDFINEKIQYNSIFVLGVEVGLDLVNQLKGIECIIVDDKGKIHSSKGIDVKKYN